MHAPSDVLLAAQQQSALTLQPVCDRVRPWPVRHQPPKLLACSHVSSITASATWLGCQYSDARTQRLGGKGDA
jgi:hypothetical protein